MPWPSTSHQEGVEFFDSTESQEKTVGADNVELGVRRTGAQVAGGIVTSERSLTILGRGIRQATARRDEK